MTNLIDLLNSRLADINYIFSSTVITLNLQHERKRTEKKDNLFATCLLKANSKIFKLN